MRQMDILSSKQEITEVTYQLQEHECMLKWRWPEGLEFVYVYQYPVGGEQSPGELPQQKLKLYTREEYKALGGYRAKLDGIGRSAFRIYPCMRDEQGLILLKQHNDKNEIIVSGRKAHIYYAIKYKKSLFGKKQKVQFLIRCEVAVERTALCYVKKEGAVPAHAEDGTVFSFLEDFEPGKNILPEIEINKQDRIRIFFTDAKKYGQIYELIPEK